MQGPFLHFQSESVEVLSRETKFDVYISNNMLRVDSNRQQRPFKGPKNRGHEVKELTPEWYCNPMFLRNRNKFKLGTSQDGDVIGDVVLLENGIELVSIVEPE